MLFFMEEPHWVEQEEENHPAQTFCCPLSISTADVWLKSVALSREQWVVAVEYTTVLSQLVILSYLRDISVGFVWCVS